MSKRFDPHAYREPRPAATLIRMLEPVGRFALRNGLRVRAVDLPAADRARLVAAVHPGTAAFLAPLHPEFLTDWLIDKEIAARVSPLMAHWASYEIVNGHPLSQRFWLANNLIANVPGGEGREYSIRWALAGHGVLLHPEGTATWHGHFVGEVLPGAVSMALETARRARAAGDARPVFVVPLVWALIFKRRATAGLERESSHLERALRLASAGSIEQRFARLQRGVLRQRHERFGESAPTDAELASGTQFFAAQAQLRDRLLERLETRHGAGGDTEFRRRLHALRRSIRERADATVDQRREDLAMLREIDRLSAFTAERYGAATLTQEQIAESLKRLRVWLLTRTARDRFHAVVPVACAPRIAHLRVPEPLAIEPHDLIADPEVTTTRLVSELRTRMQSALDALHRELEPRVAAHRRPNPFAMPRGRTA